MFRKLVFLAVGLLVPAAALAAQAQAPEQHPRFFMTPERVAAMRRQTGVEGSYHQMVFAAMKARVDNPDMKAGYGSVDGYTTGYKAVEAAFLSQLATDPAVKQQYGTIAYDAMTAWRGGSPTLGKSMESRCMALTYDWAYPVWSDAQRLEMRKRVDANLGALAGITHGNLGGDRTSNFVGVIRGAELMLRLASGEAVTSERSQFLVGELKQYFDNAFGDLGATQEGPGYTEYPAPFVFAAAYMAQEAGDATLYTAASKHAFWKLLVYARTCGDDKSLMWGVGGGADYSEGWSSQLFRLCPADQMPYYLWWYDRHQGRLSPANRPHRFDSDRHGSVWALLCYPDTVTAKDPTGTYPQAVADSRGYLFFRNRWQDADDILASISAQVKKDQKGWNQPEQLAINLIAFGTRFIGGPVKDSKPGVYSSLLVDGKYTYKDATDRMGKVVAFEPGKTGGYAIVQGGQMYEAMGVKQAERHMLVEFLPGDQAIIATLDHIKGAGEHTYTWQANTGSKAAVSTEAGHPCYVQKGRNDGFVKGWVVTPAAAQVTAGGPLQISTKGTDADILVVMFVGKGAPPVVTVRGDGLSTTLTVAGKTIAVDQATGRIVCK